MVQLYFENSNFSSTLSSNFSYLLNTSSFCDVTLVCKDGQFSAHRVLLVSSSSLFSSVFTDNPHPHPLLYMRGVKTDLMKSLLQFIYTGVTSVVEEDVTSFLALGEDLKVHGLIGYQQGSSNQLNEAFEGQDSAELNPSKQDEEKERFAQCTSSDEKDNRIAAAIFDTTYQTEPQITNSIPTTPKKEENIDDLHTIDTKREDNYEGTQLKMIPNLDHEKLERRQEKIGKSISNSSMVTAKAPRLTPKVITSTKRRKQGSQSVFCQVCQQTDNKTNDIKVHMGGIKHLGVQCKSCNLYFTNCYGLSKHKKGRCKEQKH